VNDFVLDLQRAAAYRALSLVLSRPEPGFVDEVSALSGEVGSALREPLATLVRSVPPNAELLYHALIGPSGTCRDCESDYEVNALGGKGPLLADVAGFYKAFAYEPDSRLASSPDHVAAELGFLGWLALKRANAIHGELSEAAEVSAAASKSFVKDHFGRWAAEFLSRLEVAGEGTYYGRVATLARAVLDALEPGGIEPPRERSGGPRLPVLGDEAPDACGGDAAGLA